MPYGAGPDTAVFQIGEDKFDYKYMRSKKTVNGQLVYRCIRGIKLGDTTNCLWLYKSSDGHWIATEAPPDCKDPVTSGEPKFRTQVPVHDIARPGLLLWCWFCASNIDWIQESGMQFRTYVFSAPEDTPWMKRRDPARRRASAAPKESGVGESLGSSVAVTTTLADVPIGGEAMQDLQK